MFERPRHRAIARLLSRLDGALLARWGVWFGGGTAIVLALGEYRESADVHFLCSSQIGYRTLREVTRQESLDGLARSGEMLPLVREARGDQYGVRARARLDDIDIKIEFIRETRLELTGTFDQPLGVPVLDRIDLYAEKLLANTDRYGDPGVLSRDIIDLAMMISRWGPIPQASWDKVNAAYGVAAVDAFAKAKDLVTRTDWLARCLAEMAMAPDCALEIKAALGID